jgi:hypothetical protein
MRSRVAELANRYGSDEALGIVFDDVEGFAILPDGGRASSCADCASYIGSVERNTVIVGFWSRDNPTWIGAAYYDGHDFALVDGRYIVDPWIATTESFSESTVFDLHNHATRQEILRLYGDPRSWRPQSDPTRLHGAALKNRCQTSRFQGNESHRPT